ncbi:MAG TPA: hypothetical protein VFV38_44285, partial [Ktedonobacteraceae bacterium]|nr:hypothetical protein [Ktedonobacteraceae bacterium]
NPHAPVSSENMLDDPLNGWISPRASAAETERDSSSVATQLEEKPDAPRAISDGNAQGLSSPEAHSSWLSRRRRSTSSDKEI